MNTNEKYILRCLELAKNGLPSSMPNPSVGAVIVYNGTIIGEGFTSKYGGNHAEVNAINSVKDKSLLLKSTIYVSLEPCSHFGKTPPCCDLIIQYKIPKVVIGLVDSNKKVAGQGIKRLIENRIEVIVGVLEHECKMSNKRFFTFHEKNRPYIILKWAQTVDGFIAPLRNQNTNRAPFWITNELSRQLVHKWRSEEQAILVGTQTVIDDNPSLTTRDWNGKNPVRIVLDQNNKISKESHIFDNQAKTIILNSDTINFSKNIAYQISELLLKENIQSVIIEGGSKTLQTFIDENLWDEARVFIGKTVLEFGIKAPILKYNNCDKRTILNDELLTIYNYD
ncbi:MAG: bifunctional diaminohydroxyphosphoribosylaminopyrimidine deaminase/5-amino-6-(5-phosphoribosylamino)uracil reductase RibD [Flavobacterium sp.]|nr:bifunctional diaminohydroxyphosphoribosylaminopyrimidine deaminase/5-amino-6-(5-phosphoribosylamino)uracil reductase RibD [Flavobacterium sp.]